MYAFTPVFKKTGLSACAEEEEEEEVKYFQMADKEPTEPKRVVLELSPDEAQDLVIHTNIELRDDRLKQNYATRLNNVFKKLTGHDHENWTRREGKFVPDDPTV